MQRGAQSSIAGNIFAACARPASCFFFCFHDEERSIQFCAPQEVCYPEDRCHRLCRLLLFPETDLQNSNPEFSQPALFRVAKRCRYSRR